MPPSGIGRVRLRRLAARTVPAVLGGGVLAFLVVPVIAVIPMSFSSSMVFELIPAAPGLTQYRRFFASPEWMDALGRSVQVALGTTVVATVLGTLAALGLVRIRSRWRTVLEAALISARIVPSIVFAVAAYFVFSRVGVVGTIAGLILAHSVLAFPFVVVLVTSALDGFDRSLE
jgi:ABC-type spermidine/putrescine transport system permease subunit II